MVFLHRKSSLLPFVRTWTSEALFDALHVQGETITTSAEKSASLATLLAARRSALSQGRLLELDFVTVVVRTV